MAKSVKSFRIEDQMYNDLLSIASEHYNGNATAAIEEAISHLILVLSVPEGERDLLRVSARRGPYKDTYEKYDRKMIDFFLV